MLLQHPREILVLLVYRRLLLFSSSFSSLKSLNLSASPGESVYPQILHVIPCAASLSSNLPHFGHFISSLWLFWLFMSSDTFYSRFKSVEGLLNL